jgi:hypothetical protein
MFATERQHATNYRKQPIETHFKKGKSVPARPTRKTWPHSWPPRWENRPWRLDLGSPRA